jgi:hypothetical protein
MGGLMTAGYCQHSLGPKHWKDLPLTPCTTKTVDIKEWALKELVANTERVDTTCPSSDVVKAMRKILKSVRIKRLELYNAYAAIKPHFVQVIEIASIFLTPS